jgi:hypothetical protein
MENFHNHLRFEGHALPEASVIQAAIDAGGNGTIQFAEPPYPGLDALNGWCKTFNDKLFLRFYGHHGRKFDCVTLARTPEVKSLVLNCLAGVDNFDQVRQLQHLRRLDIGVADSVPKAFLSWENLHQLVDLGLSGNKKSDVDLSYLDRITELESLFINANGRNIEAAGGLKRLTRLSLSLPNKTPIAFINQISTLQRLFFILGGRSDFDELALPMVEDLEICRVKGVTRIPDTSSFERLKRMTISDQIQVKDIHFDKVLSHLDTIKILNCKGLRSLTGLSKLPNLKQVRIYATALDFDDFMRQELPGSLETLAFYTGSERKDEVFRKRLLERGYIDGLVVKKKEA